MPDPTSVRSVAEKVYRGKRVLVTGHTGFKGGWLCLWLRSLGAEVTGISLEAPAESGAFFNAVRLSEMIDHRLADIRDPAAYAAAVHGVDADIIFHLAAQSLVRRSYADPVETFATNVTGTAVVLEHARRMSSARAVIVVTSDKCYENREWHSPYRETDELGGADPYSASKGCAELVVNAFRRSYFSTSKGGCQIATVRAGNVIGGGDCSVDRLLPDFMRASLAGITLPIRNPRSVRPWQHVLEPLWGYIVLSSQLLGSQSSQFAEAWNFGPNADGFVDVETLARAFQHAWGPGAAQFAFEKRPDDPHEAGLLTLDSNKARARLGWTPRLPTSSAVAMTADWYRTCASGQTDMRAFSQAQIDFYVGEILADPFANTKAVEVAECA